MPSKISRREFVTAGLAATTMVTMLGSKTVLAAGYPDIIEVKGQAEAAVRSAVDALGGIKRFVSKGSVVTIKPNMGFGTEPLQAATTDPAVVSTLAKMCLEAGAKKVLIFDNPCHRPELVLEKNGIKQACSKLTDTFVYIIQDSKFFVDVTFPKGIKMTKARVAKDLLESDVIIAAPAAKSHGGAIVTFTAKGWMGVVERRQMMHLVGLHQTIADLASFVKPHLVVLDATKALVTGGPGGPGKVLQLNKVIAGIDQIAIDAYAVKLAQWEGKTLTPADIPYIQIATSMGVGRSDLEKLKIITKTV